ncbi:MAG: hypothetical protein ACRDGJ_11615 [Candidatus Limnocylindria bacterium]
MHHVRLLPGLLLLVACTLAPLETPTPAPTATPTPTPTPMPTPTPQLTPTPQPTPDQASIPAFGGGDIALTTLSGMRVRRLPGVERQVVTGLLPARAELQVVMGPISVDGFGWYLVTDADPGEPAFDEGWIAAGYEPDPFIAAAGHPPESDPYLASFAHVGAAEFGPVAIPDEFHLIRWLALDPEGVGCTFAVSLAPAGAEPIPAIRATVGSSIIPGTLQRQYFTDQPTVRGQVFVSVTGDCAWTLVVVQLPAE